MVGVRTSIPMLVYYYVKHEHTRIQPQHSTTKSQSYCQRSPTWTRLKARSELGTRSGSRKYKYTTKLELPQRRHRKLCGFTSKSTTSASYMIHPPQKSRIPKYVPPPSPTFSRPHPRHKPSHLSSSPLVAQSPTPEGSHTIPYQGKYY